MTNGCFFHTLNISLIELRTLSERLLIPMLLNGMAMSYLLEVPGNPGNKEMHASAVEASCLEA